MSDDINLREKARELLRAGKLPSRRPDRIWGAQGFGGVKCMLCGADVGPGEAVLEVKFIGGGSDPDPGAANPHFHVRCFSALELELRNLEAGGRRDAA
jgi:hypothetical protein